MLLKHTAIAGVIIATFALPGWAQTFSGPPGTLSASPSEAMGAGTGLSSL